MDSTKCKFDDPLLQFASDWPHVPPGHDADRESARGEQAVRRHLPAGLRAVADGVAVRL